MSKKNQKNQNDISIEEFLLDYNYDISAYEIEKVKCKERRDQKRKKDKNRRDRFLEEY